MHRNSCGNKKITGLKVKSVATSSPFYKSGIRKGDILLSINNQKICDELDFHFFSADYSFEVEFLRNAVERKLIVQRDEGSFSEIDFFENPINRCKNRCIFCFIDQMPKGLRRGLYIKDEDFKHSFLNGNYVTLSGAKQADLEKIALIGLSPLFISVHVTDYTIRCKMLGNNRAPDILQQLQFLKENHIAFHTQIVVCPGYNDKEILIRTINDLFKFTESLLSIAVVPVGLTNFRKISLEPVTKDIAYDICKELQAISDSHSVRDGKRRLFVADEFFIKAGLPIPSRKYYEDYPQIENGVGLVRQLLEEWKQLRKNGPISTKRILKNRKKVLVITSRSAFAFVEKIASDAQNSNFAGMTEYKVVAVTNKYFGEMVTVAGLLTAKDVLSTIKSESVQCKYDMVVIPAVMFNYAGHTLDGYSVQRISSCVNTKVKIAKTIKDLFS